MSDMQKPVLSSPLPRLIIKVVDDARVYDIVQSAFPKRRKPRVMKKWSKRFFNIKPSKAAMVVGFSDKGEMLCLLHPSQVDYYKELENHQLNITWYEE